MYLGRSGLIVVVFGCGLLLAIVTVVAYFVIRDRENSPATTDEKREMMKRKASYLFPVLVLGTGCWLSANLLFGFGFHSPGWQFAQAAGCLLLSIGMNWIIGRLSYKVWLVAGLLILTALFLPTSTLIKVFANRQSELFGNPIAFTLLLILPIALIIAAMLLSSGLTLYRAGQKEGEVKSAGDQASSQRPGRAPVLFFILSVLLLAKAIHNLYWLTVWDNTDDSLGYIWLISPILGIFFSGALLIAALPDRVKLAGLLYSLFIPALLIAVSARAQRVDFRQLTEERAERVSQALEIYYARKGHYPQELQQLTSCPILSLPGPVIIYGQAWCFDGGDDYYRLGYVYREHWSDPRLSGRIYKTRGETPDLHRLCEEEVIALQKRYPGHKYEYWTGSE